MRSRLGFIPLLLLAIVPCAAPSGPAAAAEDPAPPATVAPRVVRANPMMVEIRAVLDGERATLKSLHERFRAAKDPDAAIAIQREIARVKLDTEVSILRVQAKHARAAGRADVATSLETAIQQILEPGAPPPATPRPTRTPTTETSTQR